MDYTFNWAKLPDPNRDKQVISNNMYEHVNLMNEIVIQLYTINAFLMLLFGSSNIKTLL